jgi:SAM-dependent methyltransferase
MTGFYLRLYGYLPELLRRRINPLEYAISDFVTSFSAHPGRGVVLDAGAGEVRFKESFHKHLYVAVDSKVGDRDWNYSQIDVIGDLLRIPLAAGSVDIILNIQVLEHIAQPAASIAELYRVLKPGGMLLLTAPQGWGEHQRPHDFFRFTRYSLSKIFQEAGFDSFEIEPMGGYFHYLGHRLTYVPKILFAWRRGWDRLFLFPLEVFTLAFFGFLGPLACYYLDRLDRQKEFTLCYRCRATK